MTSTKPLLLLDVDGPINVFDGRKNLPPQFRHYKAAPNGVTYNIYLDPGLGARLLAFAAKHDVELAWATTWEHEANQWIAGRIGLPQLPVVEFKFTGYSWKFGAVCAFAKGRPLAWLDDDFPEFVPQREKYFDNARKDTPSLLHWVDPCVGITDADLDTVGAWFDDLKELNR